jgi:hypothetical protein
VFTLAGLSCSRPTFSLTHVVSCPFFMSLQIFNYLSYLCVCIIYLFIYL